MAEGSAAEPLLRCARGRRDDILERLVERLVGGWGGGPVHFTHSFTDIYSTRSPMQVAAGPIRAIDSAALLSRELLVVVVVAVGCC